MSNVKWKTKQKQKLKKDEKSKLSNERKKRRMTTSVFLNSNLSPTLLSRSDVDEGKKNI